MKVLIGNSKQASCCLCCTLALRGHLSQYHRAFCLPSAELQPMLMGILAPLCTLCAYAGASPVCVELQLLLSGAEDTLHLVPGDGLPLPHVFLDDVVPDDRNLV